MQHVGPFQLQQWGPLCCGVQASPCSSLSCGGQALGAWPSVAAARGLSSWGSWALECGVSNVAHGLSCSEALWHAPRDLPGPGIEPVSPVVAGGFPSTVPPGKSSLIFLMLAILARLKWGNSLAIQWLGCRTFTIVAQI